MKRTTKILALVLAAVMLSACFVGILGGCVKTDEKLIVYNWEDYIDRDILDEFEEYYEKETGKSLSVTYSTFDTNETMLTEIEKGGSVVDLICPSEYAIQRLIDKNLLKKIDKTKVPNGANLDGIFEEKLVATFGAEYDMYSYMIPYFWGTLGILYNTEYVSETEIKEAGWGILWNKTQIDGLNGKILMKDSVRDAYVAAVMYLKEQGRLPEGYADKSAQELINDTSNAMLDAVGVVLGEQKTANVLKGYEVDLGKDDMVAGTALVNLAWSGDALYAIDEAPDGVELAYYAPESGGNLWFDGWVMPKNAQNERAALMFMDYMCRPESAMRNMIEVGYTSAVRSDVLKESEAALATLAEAYETGTDDTAFFDEFFGDEARYPNLGDTSALGVMQDFGAKEADLIAMWERVKAGQSNGILSIVLIALGVVILAAAVTTVIVVAVKKKKSRRKIRRPYGGASRAAAALNCEESDEDDEEEEEDEEDEEEDGEVDIAEEFVEVDLKDAEDDDIKDGEE